MSAIDNADLDDYTVLSPRFAAGKSKNAQRSEADYRFTDYYSLCGTVGQGGVGRVLLGFDERIGRQVAIKEMLTSDETADPEIRRRFLREAQITGRLEHPGIVPVYEMGTTSQGTPYYVMRLVRGQTLAEALAACHSEQPEQALAKRLQLLDRLIDVCEAMAYAHSKGVVHRDLKPSNIVLGQFGETIILDWGLAKIGIEADVIRRAAPTATLDASEEELTQVGEILGTPAYMAPEQVDHHFGEVDARTDVFALGCILYHILVGRPPLRGSLSSIVEQLKSKTPLPSARKGPASAPPELIAICDKALAKDKLHRFRDAAELTEELRAFRDGRLVSAYAYSRRELLRRFIARNKAALSAGLAVMIAIAAGAVLAVHFAMDARKEQQVAVAERHIALQARERAESALADVTRISNENLTAADQIAEDIVNAIDAIKNDMAEIGNSIRNLGNGKIAAPALSALLARHPEVELFASVLAAGTITAVAPAESADTVTPDTFRFESGAPAADSGEPTLSRVYETPQGFDAITLALPMKRGRQVQGFISARLKPAEFLGRLLPAGLQTGQRTVWIIEDSGFILYDTDTDEIGENLFREERFNEIPELRQLPRQIADQEAGIGYYHTPAHGNSQASNRIAAWQTARPTKNRSWKVVVLEKWG
ncbi:serine/threonine protein kinase [Methylocaldum szegediense]|uniref:Eukaryotic-like serine/threonine-protein kinase n=1 Tax=Methylocaldum szegediense TaxID=73780 RepID=A0ABN8XCE3_9GAMM|nr:protein kinase [Methylocaldum szegediense]CAI8959995.1 eukaryotic-like serine/threonine-protein kinase [Methylocaldum szegediense]